MWQRGMHAKDSPGTWETRDVSLKKHRRGRGAGTNPQAPGRDAYDGRRERTTCVSKVPWIEGDEEKREGRPGVLARHCTEEGGEPSPTGPTGGKDAVGREESEEAKMPGTLRPESISTRLRRIAK